MISLRFYGPELSQLKGNEGDVLTCHNTAWLDIQQKGPTAGSLSVTAVAEWCLKLAC